MKDKRVLTVQDISCYGQCSITVALPIISACGIETAILPSAVFSTHTGGFTGYTFRDLSSDMTPIMDHWEIEGISFDCLYTGYLGSREQITLVQEIDRRLVKKDGLFIVDPVMADNGKLYPGFTIEYAKDMAELSKNADVILPNITEACFMTDTEVKLTGHTEEYISMLLDKLDHCTKEITVLKGICFDNTRIGIAVRNKKKNTTEYYFTYKEGKSYHGTGDCFASAFTGSLLRGISPFDAGAIAADFVGECIRKTSDDESHFYGVKFEKALPGLVSTIAGKIKE